MCKFLFLWFWMADFLALEIVLQNLHYHWWRRFSEVCLNLRNNQFLCQNISHYTSQHVVSKAAYCYTFSLPPRLATRSEVFLRNLVFRFFYLVMQIHTNSTIKYNFYLTVFNKISYFSLLYLILFVKDN